jgi:hypothetical protein
MIIHLAGSQLSGKTEIAKIIKKKHRKNIIIIDLAMMLNKYCKDKRFFPKLYQKYIYDIISKHPNINILFIGINIDNGKSKTVYDVKADHKLFLDIDVGENAANIFAHNYDNIINDLFYDPCNWVKKFVKFDPTDPVDKKKVICREWVKNEKFHTDRLIKLMSNNGPMGIRENINKLRETYKELGYEFVKKDKIVTHINDMISFQTF